MAADDNDVVVTMLDTDSDVSQWMKQQVQAEVVRIRSLNANAIPVPIKNVGIVRKSKGFLNRLEVNTSFDFDKVKRLMISEPIAAPKAGYSYVHVLCFTDQAVPLILPYLYHTNPTNDLKHWLFQNNQFQRSQHCIEEYKAVVS